MGSKRLLLTFNQAPAVLAHRANTAIPRRHLLRDRLSELDISTLVDSFQAGDIGARARQILHYGIGEPLKMLLGNAERGKPSQDEG